MGKKKVQEVVDTRTPEERAAAAREQLVIGIVETLRNHELDSAQRRWNEAVEKGSRSSIGTMIRFYGYEMMVGEALQYPLSKLREKIEATLAQETLSIEDKMRLIVGIVEKHQEQQVDNLTQAWRVEWDRSTNPFANQNEKAESRAVQLLIERCKDIRRNIAYWAEQVK